MTYTVVAIVPMRGDGAGMLAIQLRPLCGDGHDSIRLAKSDCFMKPGDIVSVTVQPLAVDLKTA